MLMCKTIIKFLTIFKRLTAKIKLFEVHSVFTNSGKIIEIGSSQNLSALPIITAIQWLVKLENHKLHVRYILVLSMDNFKFKGFKLFLLYFDLP